MTPSPFEAGLLALERLRGEIDDAVLDVALAALRERLAAERERMQPAPPEQQLRQVTVMFVDVVGSTALGGRLEPEDIHLVMDTALERFTAIVQRYRGRALQYAGDSLLAAFGTAESREDDAENAVAAGLGILGEARLLADRVRRQHQHPGFNVRVGLHTGPVLLGGGVDAAGTIRGATVNLAARMEQSATPGTLRISDDTARQVQGLFDLDEQPPLQVKGHVAPLRTWLVDRQRPLRHAALRRGVAGVATPLVGCDAPLASLCSAWQALHASAPGETQPGVAILSVVAEAGLGKTRLAQHWEAWAWQQPQRALWLVARARAQAQQVPYALLSDLIADALQLPDSDSPAAARERFTASVVPYFEADFGDADAVADAHVLGQLLGHNFSDSPHLRGIAQLGGQIRQRALHTAAELLARLAARHGQPLVLLLDDLQWADSGSLDFLRGLPTRRVAAPQPALIVALARPALDERQADWAAAEHQRLTLQPLDDTGSHTLAAALLAPLQADATSPAGLALRQALVDRAGGNAFFMEELLQMLLAQGTISAQPGNTTSTPSGDEPPRWQLREGRVNIAALPTTLNGVLQAQIDLLPAAERLALQQAAVLGSVFFDRTLAALDGQALDHLPALARRGLLQARERGAPGDPAAYGFAHAFLQQVAYARLLRHDRQALHARAARWYAALDTARAVDYLAEAADHFDRAAEPLDAARFNLLAAENLAQRFAHDAVVERASLGLGQAAADDTGTPWKLLMLRQRALRLSGQRDAQALDLDALDALAERTADPVHLATVALRRTVAASETGHPQDAAALAPKAMAAALRAGPATAERAGEVPFELAVFGAWCGALRACGQHDEARQVGEQGLARARALGQRGPESELLVSLAAIAAEQADSTGSATLLRQALHIQQLLGNRAGECVSRINLGVTALQQGELVTAEADFDAAQRLARQIGNPTFEVSTLLNRASARLPLGRVDEAHDDAQAAVALAQKIGNPEYEAFALMAQGAALLARSQWPQARAAFAGSRQLLDGLGLGHLSIEAVAWLAREALQSGDLAAALAHTETVLAHLADHGKLDGTEDPLLIRWTCCEVLEAAADPRAAGLRADTWAALQQRLGALATAEARGRFLQAQAHHRAIHDRAARAGLV